MQEFHGKEAELSCKDGVQETVSYGLDRLRDGGEYVLPHPYLRCFEVLQGVGRPLDLNHKAVEAAMREAYPPEKLAGNTDPSTLRYDYEDCSLGSVDWWTNARHKVLRFMYEAYEDCHVEVLHDLELIRERATVQQLLADLNMDRRWVTPWREA